MKLIHLSDLHIGKRVNEMSMIEDQAYILLQILQIIDEEKADAVLIAGDVYDKSVPSAEAVTLFDDFLCRLAKRNKPVLIISGNHDSPERLAFGNRLLELGGIHISPVYDGNVRTVTLADAHGEVVFWLLPFVKPAHVKRFYPDAGIESYTDACRVAVEQMGLDTGSYLSYLFQKLLSPALLPALTFLIAMLISFATGTSMGTMAIMAAISIPMAATMDVSIPLVAGAMFGGSIFGDHCSPISDTTIMTCSTTGCNIIDHVKTQMPYCISIAAISFVMYVIFGFVM